MSAQIQKILVYSENQNILQELLGKVQGSVTGDAAALYIGAVDPQTADFARWGANTLYSVIDPKLKEFNPETFSDVLAEVITSTKPDFVMIGATKQGLELSAKVAERLEISCASWCVDFELSQTVNKSLSSA